MRTVLSCILLAYCFSGEIAFGQSGVAGLECKLLVGPTAVSGSAPNPEAATSVAPIDPIKELAGGFRITGGGCQQAKDGPYGALAISVPSNQNYTCRVVRNDTAQVSVTAYAVACRSPGGTAASRPTYFTSNGLGGSIVTLMRTSNDASSNYTVKIPHSVRLCNFEGGTTIGVYSGVYDSTSGTDYTIVPFGQCMEVDQPKELMFHTTESVTINVSGTFQLFEPGTFPSVPRLTSHPAGANPMTEAKYSYLSTDTGSCQAFPPAPYSNLPPGVPLGPYRTDFWGFCEAPKLIGEPGEPSTGKNYRVCFDATGYSNQPSGTIDYTGGLLPMILDPTLMTKADLFGEFTLNLIAPGGCRDLFNITHAYFLVAPSGGNWINKTMTKLTYRYTEIP
jgi:hypothetical protein